MPCCWTLPWHRYEILRTCIAELQQAAIIADAVPLALYGEACQLEEARGEASAGAAGAAGAAAAEHSSMEEEEGETEQLQAKYLRWAGAMCPGRHCVVARHSLSWQALACKGLQASSSHPSVQGC